MNNLSDHRLWPKGNFPSMSHRFWDQAKNKFCHCEAKFEASIFFGCPISHAWVIIDKKTDEYILGDAELLNTQTCCPKKCCTIYMLQYAKPKYIVSKGAKIIPLLILAAKEYQRLKSCSFEIEIEMIPFWSVRKLTNGK